MALTGDNQISAMTSLIDYNVQTTIPLNPGFLKTGNGCAPKNNYNVDYTGNCSPIQGVGSIKIPKSTSFDILVGPSITI